MSPVQCADVARDILTAYDGTRARLVFRDGTAVVGEVEGVSPVNAWIKVKGTRHACLALRAVEAVDPA